MNVLLVAPYLGLTYGGTSKVVLELAKSINSVSSSINVDVVSTNANGDNFLNVELGVWIEKENYRIQYFPTWYRNDLIVSLPLAKWLLKSIKRYDMIHTHTIFAPIISFTTMVCNLYNKPYIITPHGMLDPWALSYKAQKKTIYYSIAEKKLLQNADAIHVLARSEAMQIKKLGYPQGCLIPNGIPNSFFNQTFDEKIFYQKFPELYSKKLILFLSRIDPKKGLDILASAFSKVNASFPNTHLVLAGPDSINYKLTVEKYFSDAGCLESVTFTGMLSGSLKYSALAAADFYVLPSYSEGFSMSVLEGMASGLPCIISENCNFPEAKKANAAHIVKPDSESVAQGLLQYLREPQKAQQMGDLAKQFIFQNYTWEKSAKKLIQLYHSILEDRELKKKRIFSS
ncbi:group 1 glycosyl transferase [Leptolyngbya sp. Heron Island J]|uniref:glycosyltransferase n=1 Tax=Leptolyngbya sp. Heron Island J TaxID=1385935 RepID=UPI0003B9EE68|nr:glycosyltransferase [Leptolyngbya sp. Heron Island J]ESA38760.1 group 1 glycosyl transferase [Leptolyngbya sp. Heron Island J]